MVLFSQCTSVINFRLGLLVTAQIRGKHFIMFLFSAERVNQAPKAILNPLTQTVLLPTKQAIIDASGSTDDTEVKELTYNW